jgi:acetoin utilization deacetylase AcuC-like enzyme
MKVGFCTSPRFLDHQTGPHHPERPDRLRAIFAAVRDAGMVSSPRPTGDEDIHFGMAIAHPPHLVEIQPRPATVDEVLLVHTQRHIDRVRIRSKSGGLLDNGDTPVSHDSYDVALLAAGAGLTCVDAIMSGQVKRAFAAVRPPGHHAEPNAAMGFCLFSNVAIAARYAQKHYQLSRIAIVDFDVHHGNGTQAVFFADPSVFFASLHEDPHILYPNSGFEWERGAAAGRGHTLNLPMPAGADDAAYLKIMRERLLPALDDCKPQLLLVSAGFDAHQDDPLADISLTEVGFYQMTRLLVEVANRHCHGRILSMLEGGYNLRALGRSVIQHLLALSQH